MTTHHPSLTLALILLPLFSCQSSTGKDPAATGEDADGDGFVADEDCDDTDPDRYPGNPEVCDGVDNDCDGDVDDADPSLDGSTRSTWYADSDSDGFGDPGATTPACAAPSGYVADATDCDDAAGDVNPDAAEVCNGIDDDCDTLVDDADDDVDTSTGSTFFADGDGDGYGDAGTTVQACVVPSGYVTDDLDCDDGDDAVNPAATEVCDEIDNDCDGSTDDDDPGLDLSTAETWYEDADGDGRGSSTSTDLACVQPSGYVDDDSDCDDADPTDAVDLDGDGTPDCSDADIDGDGLRNEWDADPEDDTVVRGPTEGLGTDGPLILTGTDVQSDWTLLSSGVAASETTLPVDDSSVFTVGDEVLVLSQMGGLSLIHI